MHKLKLKSEQQRLAENVITNDMFEDIEYIGGCDQAYTDDNRIISYVVVMDRNMKIVDSAHEVAECRMPYIPGYMFYREGPAVVEAFSKLRTRPDVLMVDANGILHPRRIGMASQLGIALDVPTIGIAKNLMMGKVMEGKVEVDKEIRAAEVKTRDYAKPLYVSPGHRISVRTAEDLVKRFIIHPHKLPEPLHLAHRYSNKRKKVLMKKEGVQGQDSHAEGRAQTA
ncbi:MAG: endonuclease V [Candidatus Woesearchaeota archaeon]